MELLSSYLTYIAPSWNCCRSSEILFSSSATLPELVKLDGNVYIANFLKASSNEVVSYNVLVSPTPLSLQGVANALPDLAG